MKIQKDSTLSLFFKKCRRLGNLKRVALFLTRGIPVIINTIKEKEIKKSSRNRIAIFQFDSPFQVHTQSFVENIVKEGFAVDVFFCSTQVYADVVALKKNSVVRFIEIPHVSSLNLRMIAFICHMMTYEKYFCFIGIEKIGFIIAGILGCKRKIPYWYYSLEIENERNNPDISKKWKNIRKLEKYFHAMAVGTIVQDQFRYLKLLSGNEIEESTVRVAFLPVSVSGPKVLCRNNYFHKKFNLHESVKILIYWGMICPNRYCNELAEISNDLPQEWVLVFHGFFSGCTEQQFKKYDKLLISTDLLPAEMMQIIPTSATIGLTIYNNENENDRLTAMSSEKIAYFMQSGIPVITSTNESYDYLFSNCMCGISIRRFEEISMALSTISANYQKFSEEAYKAFNTFYNYEKNFHEIRSKVFNKSE